MMVLVLPPSESFNNLVSLESRYGTKDPCLNLSERTLMQLPSARSDLLMLAPSTILCPLFSVFAARSDPAKSTIDNLDVIILSRVPLTRECLSILIIRTACDRDENKFAPVGAIVLLSLPAASKVCS